MPVPATLACGVKCARWRLQTSGRPKAREIAKRMSLKSELPAVVLRWGTGLTATRMEVGLAASSSAAIWRSASEMSLLSMALRFSA